MSTRWGSTPRLTDRLTDRQSQCDFDLTFEPRQSVTIEDGSQDTTVEDRLEEKSVVIQIRMEPIVLQSEWSEPRPLVYCELLCHCDYE
jgi:hypothetical protein